MIATSGCCRRRPSEDAQCRRGRALAAGFTLTEVLVVLVIMGLILGFSGSRYDSYRLQTELQNEARLVSAQIHRVQLQNLTTVSEARIDQETLERFLTEARTAADTDSGRPPAPVVVRVTQPLQITADGACSSGTIWFDLADFRYALEISAPFCDAVISRVR